MGWWISQPWELTPELSRAININLNELLAGDTERRDMNEAEEALGYPVAEALADVAGWIEGATMYGGMRGWRPACAVLACEVQRLQAEVSRLALICQSAHDRLLRGDDDHALLEILEQAWKRDS